ncbi:MAG: histidinol-phosphate transaminase [Pseudomonadota bacterium]
MSRFTDFESVAQAGVRALTPYLPGKPLSELEREFGITDAVKLASNENPLGISAKARAAVERAVGDLARYPDGGCFEIKAALAKRLGVAAEQITLGNGSNDVLDLIARVFAGPGDEVIFSEHAFAVYPIATQAVGATAVVTPAKDWGHDLAAMLAAITPRTRLIFIANPNNPTGTWLKSDELQAFIQQVPERIPVVVDEAYFEYARYPAMGAADYPDALAWVERHPNLIVARTFSKAYGLAGLRLGYSVAHRTIAGLINRVRQPFNVNSLAQVAALAVLGDADYLQQGLMLNAAGMQQLTRGFEALGLDYIPSIGNFVCVDVGRPGVEVYNALLREGVIVRPVANYGMPRHLRVSIGLERENARFLAALGKVLAAC